MKKKIFIFLISALFILGMNKLSLAVMCTGNTAHGEHTQIAQTESSEHEHGTIGDTQASSKEVVNVGNKICPVSGEKIDDKMKATYEYEGKIYNFCCPMCIEEFKKDPAKYIKKIEEELSSVLKEETKEGSTNEHHH